ncbi:MAG TPA: hypothetical protein VFD92_00805 [Candidatus Binatia bacterium]|nr:hypothetical protein [Candidatus Binatia bacterium]
MQGEEGNYGSAVGPFRMTVILGGAAEGAGGKCAEHAFAAADCKLGSKGKKITCN